MASGEAAWTPPDTNPYPTAARIDRFPAGCGLSGIDEDAVVPITVLGSPALPRPVPVRCEGPAR
jgi:hypothetical protein